MKVKFEFTLTEKSSAATMVQDILHEFVLACEVEDGKLKVPSFEARMRVARDCIAQVLDSLHIES